MEPQMTRITRIPEAAPLRL